MSQPPAASRTAGFSLIEVIVSLAIVAFGLAAFSQAIGGSYRAAQRTRQQAVALSLAQSHLDTLGVEGGLDDGLSTGKYSNGMPWRLTVAPLVAPAETTLKAELDRPPVAPAIEDTIPYWIVVEAFDLQGRPLVKLQTAKLGKVPRRQP